MKREKFMRWFVDSLLVAAGATAGVFYGIKMVNFEVVGGYQNAVFLYCTVGITYVGLTIVAMWLKNGPIEFSPGRKLKPNHQRLLLVLISCAATATLVGPLIALGHLASTVRKEQA